VKPKRTFERFCVLLQVVRRALLAVAALLAMALPSAAGEARFPVRFFVPSKAGDRFFVRQEMTQKRDFLVTRDSEPVRQLAETNRIELAALGEIMAVDERGVTTKMKLAVATAVLLTNDGNEEILPPGAIVMVESKDAGTTFQMVGKAEVLPPLAERLLPRIIHLGSDARSGEEMFGTTTPRAVGARWPANQPALMAKLHELDPGIQPADASGAAELTGIGTVDGRKYLNLKTVISAKTLKPRDPPPNTVPVGATIVAVEQLRFPADYATPAVTRTMKLAMSGTFDGKPGTDQEPFQFKIESVESSAAQMIYGAASLPAYQAARKEADAPAAHQPQRRVDMTQPESVLREFLAALVAKDQEKIERLIMPDPNAAILWRGEKPSDKNLRAAQSYFRSVVFQRRKAGEVISLQNGRKLTLAAVHVNKNRTVLTSPGFPTPYTLIRRRGQWRVDAAPLIEANMAAARLRHQQQEKKQTGGTP